MSMSPTKITRVDEEFAGLLGFKPSDSFWKPHLFIIARFREETERLACEEIAKKHHLVPKRPEGEGVQVRLTKYDDLPVIEAPTHKLHDSVIWALFAASRAAEHGSSDSSRLADGLFEQYKTRFGSGK